MPNTSNDPIQEILEYLVDNVLMIKARMIRGVMPVDEGKAHNRRLKEEAHQSISKLLLENRIDAVTQIYEKRRLIIPNEFESLYIVDANIIKEIRLELKDQLNKDK